MPNEQQLPSHQSNLTFLRAILFPLLLLIAIPAWSTPPPLMDFARKPEVASVKISPDGAHLAVRSFVDGKAGVVIMRTDTLKPIYLARLDGAEQIGSYHWGNNERLLLQVEEMTSWEERPENYGEWFAVNIDGKNKRAIYGMRKGTGRGGLGKLRASYTYGTGRIVDLLPEDPKHVLISSTPWKERSSSTGSRPILLRVNIYNGRTRDVAISPVPYAQFLTDQEGKPRFVSGSTDDGEVRVYYRDDEDGEWILRHAAPQEDGGFRPLAFKDKNTVFVAESIQTSTEGIYTLDLETGERTLIYHNEDADPSNAWFTDNGRKLFAVEYSPLLPEYVYLDEQARESRLVQALLKYFPDKHVRLASQTEDGRLAIIVAFSDTDPATYYLFDREKTSISKLFDAMPWVNPETSATVKPIEFEARDGMIIRGFLTLPHGVEAKNLPLVVNPHGGPHGPRDWWGYSGETQMFASRGIAVLQVNFRGSGGYGRDFEHAGYRKWGREIQYDIIDATRYVIEQGYADEKRVCIYGGSFGGYSALQSPIVAPEMFACTVGFVGVYDLPMMYDKGDIPESRIGVKALEQYIGRDEQELHAFSPVHNVDKLNLPIFLVHGEEDPRVPIEQAYALRDALDAANKPYEWMALKKEGHGFYNDENRAELYARLLDFIGRHLDIPREDLGLPAAP